MELTTFRSGQNFCKIFWIILHHIYDTAEMTTIVLTHLQFENNHIQFVNEINTRSVFMVLPKSSQCMYKSRNTPVIVLQLHIIIVVMYTKYLVDIFFTLTGIPANLYRKIIEANRISNSPFSFVSFLFMLK